MGAELRRRSLVVFGLLSLASMGRVVGQEPSAESREEDKAKLERMDRQFQESLDWYRLSDRSNPDPSLKPRPVLRWTNATRGQKGEPTLIFWTGAGRPEALASVYPWKGHLVFECVSLARLEGLAASEGDRVVWSPKGPGVTFRDLPGGPAPSEIPAARLLQMKALSERFKVTLTGAGREELRLLPRPIYRYEVGDRKITDPELVDGAAFAFVQGTDPEAVLMVEAVRRDGKFTWQYAFGRATTWSVEARLGSSVVWTTDAWDDPSQTTKVLGRPLVD